MMPPNRLVSIVFACFCVILASSQAWTTGAHRTAKSPSAEKKIQAALRALVEYTLANGRQTTLVKEAHSKVGLMEEMPIMRLVVNTHGPDREKTQGLSIVYDSVDGKKNAAILLWDETASAGKGPDEVDDSWLFRTDVGGALIKAAHGGGKGDNVYFDSIAIDTKVRKKFDEVRATLLKTPLKQFTQE